MRLITTFELATRNQTELAILFREAELAAICSESGSPERRNALANMENIQRRLRLTP
ncbi:MAG: hypothetical protein HYS17_06210 [Micavibrio aeruginosavorus]|uniref:Uncharacterized protein n=1 Tax=Micavibrio aeruginosavorus TaxID=349221 RepID=A0A7T5UFG5_9BACT|nr:MAG: hypothetical protein HYS17_06210 [Micavibrio aeruginosavorus]